MARPRTNMAERREDRWRPIPLVAPGPLRRFFDLQTGSIWRDIAGPLLALSGKLLDVGCGAQPYRPLVPAYVTYRAIDSAGARKHFGYSMPETEYFEGTRWPIADGAVDAVLCTETLEHVPEPLEFLREAYRCLSPREGKLILTVPFAARWHFIPVDYWRFTPSSLERLLRSAGFGNIEVYARGNAFTVACYKNMALVVSLLLPQRRRGLGTLPGQALGALLLPAFLTCAVLGNLSLYHSGGG